MGKQKEYILLKDVVELKAGSVLKYQEVGPDNFNTQHGYYLSKGKFNMPLPQGSVFYYSASMVENNPEWFEEVFKKVDLTLEMKIENVLEEFIDKFNVNKDKGTISINKGVADKIVSKIKELIEIPQNINIDEKGAVEMPLSDSRKIEDYNPNQVYFLTEDGVKCNMGTTIYGICLHATGPDQWKDAVLPFSVKPGKNRVWFASKEKAAEYLIFNKRCLSIADIKRGIHIENISREYFSELAKERI